jgi:hypothetical protein
MKQKTKTQTTYWISVIIVGIALGLALQFVRAWTEPTDAPPNGNVGAPINTSFIGQLKQAGLALNVGDIYGNYKAYGLLVPNGNVGIGTVSPGQKLDVAGGVKIGDASVPPTPTPTAAGTIRWNETKKDFEGYDGNSWKSFTSTDSVGGGKKLFTANGTWTVPVGVTAITVTAVGGGGGGVASYWGDGDPTPPPGNCPSSPGHLYGGGGGSGGFKKTFSLAVTPGKEYAVDIGIGGASTSDASYAGSGDPTIFRSGATELVRAEGGQGGANLRYDCVGGSAGAGCSPGGNGGDGTADAGGAGGRCPAAAALGGSYGNGSGGGCGAAEADRGKSGALMIEW